MSRFLSFLLVFAFLGCQESTISEEELDHLNGYWEINEVEFSDGAQKNYNVNPSIDFIYFDGSKGYRKKVQPKLNGTYQTSNDSESFDIIKVNENFTLRYPNDPNQREESLIALDSISFTIRNGEGVLYTYKRFQPITIPK